MEIFAPAARTTTATSKDFGSRTFKGGIFFLNITAVSGTTPTMTVKIQYKDTLTGTYVDVPGGAFAAKTSAGVDSLTIYPGVISTANRSVMLPLGDEFRAVATIGGTTPSFTFSLSFDGIE